MNKLKTRSLLRNANGQIWFVLETNGYYFLAAQVSNEGVIDGLPFVVASNWNPETQSWGSGSYFPTNALAKVYFAKKKGRN